MMKTEEEAGRVLIVDDSEQHRSAIAGEVSKLGYDVEVAPSGAEHCSWSIPRNMTSYFSTL